MSAVEDPDALSVIEKTCKEKDARLYLLGRDIWVAEIQNVRENDSELHRHSQSPKVQNPKSRNPKSKI